MKQQWIMAALGMLLFAGIGAGADLGLSDSVIDFGTVKEGPPVEKTVTLTNNGTRTLVIANAAAS